MDHKKHPKIISWFLNKPKITGFLTFLLLSFIAGFIVTQQYQLIKEDEQREMNNILQVVHQNIEQSLKNCYTTTLTLALTINDKGVPENFDYIGAKLIESNNSISAVQLVPKGVIKYIYPMKGNEAAMNLNILKHPYLKEALKSIENQKMYFAGPLKLKQGGMGIVGRFPVFRNNKFWGFSAVIIKLETFLKSSGINNIDDSKYYFQFSKVNPYTGKEEFFLANKEDFSKKYFQTVTIPDGDWKLYLIAREKNAVVYQIITSSVLGLLFALFCGLWAASILKKPARLQLLVNDQAQNIV